MTTNIFIGIIMACAIIGTGLIYSGIVTISNRQKMVINVLLIALILFTSCERQSGRMSRSGQIPVKQDTVQKSVEKTNGNVMLKAVVINAPVYMGTDSYRQKVKVIMDGTVGYAQTAGLYEIGDTIRVATIIY